MAEKDADNSEAATPYKLEKAKEKGTVAKSADFVSIGAMAILVASVYAYGWKSAQESASLMLVTLQQGMRVDWEADGIAFWIGQLILDALSILAPLFIGLVIAAILGGLLQTGAIFTFEPLKPELNRVNPMTGLKRLFSLRTVYESGKSAVKIVALSVIAYLAITELVPGLLRMSSLDAKGYLPFLVRLSGGVLVKLLIVLLIVAMIDFVYTRWEFAKRMRMSKRDVKDEHKQREGDPRIRQRIRELQKELLKRSKAVKQIPSSDVLITNPTHIAVALRYKHGEAMAPQVMAKGAGELARKMRMIASRHNIPVVQNRELARSLFREVGFEEYVPEKFYPQLAKIMVWVYAMREARQSRRAA